jgi:MFS family permease
VHASFLPVISRDFHLSLAQSSLYLSLNFWGALASVILAGPIAGRVGSRRVLAATWLLEMLGVGAVGLAPHPMVAYAGVLLASLSFGAITVVVPHMVSAMEALRRGRAMSLLVSFYTLGAVASNLLVLLLFAAGASWRAGYLLASAMGVPWGFLLFAASDALPPGGRPAPRHGGEEAQSEESVPRNRSSAAAFVALCVAQLAGGGAEVSTSMWVPTFLSRENGAPESLGPVSLLLFCVMGAVGKLANAAATERVAPRLLNSAGFALFAAGLVTAALSADVATALVGFSLVGLGTGGFIPAVTVRMAERFPNASASRYSVFMAVGNLGPVVGPILVATVAAGDLRLGMLAMLPAAAICFAIIASLGRRSAKARLHPGR